MTIDEAIILLDRAIALDPAFAPALALCAAAHELRVTNGGCAPSGVDDPTGVAYDGHGPAYAEALGNRSDQSSLILLAHDRDDTVIPVAESRTLVAALSGRPGVRYTEFTLFKHLDPTKVRLPPLALARELGKFVRSVYPMFRQAV